MKTVAIVVAALLGAFVLLGGFVYASIKFWPRIQAEYMPDLVIDATARAKEAQAKLDQASDPYSRWVAMPDAAAWSATLPNNEKAAALAVELLSLTEKYASDWNYGNAIHKANSALGRIALRKGDLSAARSHLLASAISKGSPQMNTFGPNMGFALEMINAGEKATVLEYFTLCRAFWEMGQDQLTVWERAVREGKRPRFGPNLLY